MGKPFKEKKKKRKKKKMKKNYTYVYNDLERTSQMLPQHVIQLQITWLSWYLRVFFSSLNKLLSRLHICFTFLEGLRQTIDIYK